MALDYELNYLLAVKYSVNGKYIRFNYNGYDVLSGNDGGVSEFSYFVLVNTVDQTMTTTNDRNDVFTFLELSDDGKTNLKNDLSKLFDKSNKLLFYRKLHILILVLFEFYKN